MNTNNEQIHFGGALPVATARDRILLAAHGIVWMASQVESVASQQAMFPETVVAAAAASHRERLEVVASRMGEILMLLGDYCNGRDLVCETDVALLAPIFELLRDPREFATREESRHV